MEKKVESNLIGIISDIHGNIVALNSVLDDMPKVDMIICAGDIVGYNPWPKECVKWTIKNQIPSVMGNHDRSVVKSNTRWMNNMATEGIKYSKKKLDKRHIKYLKDLPNERKILDGKIKIVHGHPDDPNHYTRKSELKPDLLEDEKVLIMGHTHIQFNKKYKNKIIVNPGSVGQPRDGNPRAAYSVLNLENLSISQNRVEYDIDKVVKKIEKEGLPKRIGTRLYEGH